MKTTERFDNSVSKLYTAYHEDLLNAYNCSSCAVGTICNGNSDWSIMLQYNKFRLVIDMYLKEDDFNPEEYLKEEKDPFAEESAMKTLARGAVQTLPVAGSLVGGVVAGGPTLGAAALGGSALGAMSGHAAQTLIEENFLFICHKSTK